MNVDECKWQWGTCPHSYSGLRHHCPLFVESHNARALGCVDDLARPCKVERGDASLPKMYDTLCGRHSVVQFARRARNQPPGEKT